MPGKYPETSSARRLPHAEHMVSTAAHQDPAIAAKGDGTHPITMSLPGEKRHGVFGQPEPNFSTGGSCREQGPILTEGNTTDRAKRLVEDRTGEIGMGEVNVGKRSAPQIDLAHADL